MDAVCAVWLFAIQSLAACAQQISRSNCAPDGLKLLVGCAFPSAALNSRVKRPNSAALTAFFRCARPEKFMAGKMKRAFGSSELIFSTTAPVGCLLMRENEHDAYTAFVTETFYRKCETTIFVSNIISGDKFSLLNRHLIKNCTLDIINHKSEEYKSYQNY